MVASIKPHLDEVGLVDGLLLIDGQWGPAGDGQTWDHRHPATGEHVPQRRPGRRGPGRAGGPTGLRRRPVAQDAGR